MRRLLLTLICLCGAAHANGLTLEFAQEGEPSQPRALIVIHNAFESRDDLKTFFAAWANGSWGRDQYCSVYCFEYEANGLTDLESSEKLAQTLLDSIRSDDFASSKIDEINPAARTAPTDGRQPLPSLRGGNLQLIVAGSGYGGLVARRLCLLAKARQSPVHRVAYIGTPLDGLSTIDMVLGLTIKERAAMVGLPRAVEASAVGQISEAWWTLTELFDQAQEWPTVFAPAYQDPKMVAAYAVSEVPHHPTDNVLYGRYRPRSYTSPESHDGFLPLPVAWGKLTGPITWLSETTLAKTSNSRATESSSEFILKQALDRPVVYDYLARREGIEAYFKEKVGEPPLYQYWDERDSDGHQAQWRGAYVNRKGLYEMMWGVAP